MIDQDTLAAAFNEWMRRYIEEPERFAHEIQTVRQFMATMADGNEPSYGDECAAYLLELSAALSG
jgi:hypothetical protein